MAPCVWTRGSYRYVSGVERLTLWLRLGRDVSSFLFLTHLPTYSLLSFFYGIRPTSALIAYGVTIVSTALPFALLRRSSSVHNLSHAPADAVANRNILQDRTTTVFTTLLAT